MKSTLALLFLSMFMLLKAEGQTVKVLEKEAREPLELVTVFGSESGNSSMTGPKGKAKLTGFSEKDTLEFRLIGYETRSLSYKAVEEAEFLVLLTKKPFDLNEFVVSANRWEQRKKDVPNRITTIDQEAIDFQNPQTSADVLETSGEVYVQKSQLGGGSPMIRGFATNRVLLVMDGTRMNNAIFRSGNLQNVISIDPHTVENAEIIFGPGSIMYGSDAIGGVMDFHTLEPSLSREDSMISTGNALVRVSSANQEITGHADLELSGTNWASVSSFSYSKFGHQQMGSNGPDDYLRESHVIQYEGKDTVVWNQDAENQIPSGYDQTNFMQKVRLKPNENWDLRYGFHYSSTSDIPRYDRLTEKRDGQFRNAEWYYGPQQWTVHNLKVEVDQKTALFDQLKVNGSYQTYEESRHDRGFQSPWLRHRAEEVTVGSANLNLNKQVGEETRLFYGLDFIHNLVGSQAERQNIQTGEEMKIGTRYPDGATWDSYGAYLLLRHKPTEKLTLNGGIRYDRVLMEANLDTSHYPFPFTDLNINTGAPAGNLGLVYRPSEKWQLRLNGSTGFRAPNVDDAGKVFDSEPGSVVVPNDDLSPEYAYNADLGIARTFSKRMKVEVTGFYTWLSNAMVRRAFQYEGKDSIVYDGALSEVQASQNVGKAVVYGFQASITAELGAGFSTNANYNFTEGETGEGAAVRHVAPDFGRLHLIWKNSRIKADLYAKYNGAIPYEDLAPSERGKPHLYAKDEKGRPHAPSWYTLNAKASYQIIDQLEVSVGLENILDKRYRPYSSGITAPGRNLIVAVRGTF